MTVDPEEVQEVREQVARESRERGLYDKYLVARKEDPTGKHDDCRYFVLDPQHDVAARKALETYILAIRPTNYELSKELTEWLWGIVCDEAG